VSHSFHHSFYSHSLLIYSFSLDMGSQKTAAKRKPNSGRSGTRKSVKENLPPTLKLPYPKPRPAYKAASTSSTDAANVGNGEAAAVAALVSMHQSESAFNRTY
jgi:hypothetical protein